MSRSRDDDRGQVAPLLALLAVAIGLACFGLGRLGRSAVDSAAARTAADAAALAGAAGGENEARRLAIANGGRLERYEAAGSDVRTRVAVGRASAVSARARSTSGRDVAGMPAGARPDALAPAMRAALARAEQILGRRIPITSGYRSQRQQAALFFRRAANPFPVAPPGTSMHERGLAVDVPVAIADELAAVGRQAGLCRPYARTDPVHFELCAR